MFTFTFIAHPSREWEPLLKTMSAITPGQAYTITVSNTPPDATQNLVGVCLDDCEHKGQHVFIDVADPNVLEALRALRKSGSLSKDVTPTSRVVDAKMGTVQ